MPFACTAADHGLTLASGVEVKHNPQPPTMRTLFGLLVLAAATSVATQEIRLSTAFPTPHQCGQYLQGFPHPNHPDSPLSLFYSVNLDAMLDKDLPCNLTGVLENEIVATLL